MHPLLNIASQAARIAGKNIVQAFDRLDSVKITEKAQHDFVTDIDKLSERIIIEAIHTSYPNHAILAEESGASAGEGAGDDHVWVIDPIDGTTNFIHGIPHFSISIAMKYKGEYQIGLVYDPIQDEMFMASKGEGARLNDTRIRVSNKSNMDYALLATGFPFKKAFPLIDYLKTFATIFPKAAGVRRQGSAALDLAYVAAGRYDGYWEASLQPWDIAAGCLLVKEAGGLVTDFDNTDQYMEQLNVVAGNPKIQKELIGLIQKSIK